MTTIPRVTSEGFAHRGLPSPSSDIGNLSERLGMAWGVSGGECIPQYLAWSEQAGLFSALSKHGPLAVPELQRFTCLNESGLDALLGILASVGVVMRCQGAYGLTTLAREYLLKDSPYYIGATLYMAHDKPLPPTYCAQRPAQAEAASQRPSKRWSVATRLQVQHDRNLVPCIVAARSGCFDDAKHVIDMGGGSGTFAIPLALRRPDLRITLVDLPEVIPETLPFLHRHGVADRIDLVALDLMAHRWHLPPADLMFFGNIFHWCTDTECEEIAAKSFDALSPGGRIWLHEVLMNDNRDGSLIAALWNANMAVYKEGARQRTTAELFSVLCRAGFMVGEVIPTAGRFSLIAGTKPR